MGCAALSAHKRWWVSLILFAACAVTAGIFDIRPWHPIKHRFIGHADRLIKSLFDLNVRNHLAANFRKPTLPACNSDEPVLIDDPHVSGDVPTVLNDFTSQFVAAIVSFHDVGAFDHEHARLIGSKFLIRVQVDDLGGDTRNRTADRSLASVFTEFK